MILPWSLPFPLAFTIFLTFLHSSLREWRGVMCVFLVHFPFKKNYNSGLLVILFCLFVF